ncbi:hypothetical protein HQ544_05100 [Candidatus Falkowbacteria bacterium]|nr:hypothetical protein [Candidatus Falkowbacteria bacterium]
MSVTPKSSLINKHVLLDTCFIIKAYQYNDTSYFNKLFLHLKNNNCIPVINEFIKFEFLCGCKTKEHISIKTDFLDFLSPEKTVLSLPIDECILNDAIKISNIYSNKNVNSKHPNAIDCYISAYLKKYEKNLLFVTLDNNDYPLILHDRIGIHTIDTEEEILVLGFYKFNNKKFEKLSKNIK